MKKLLLICAVCWSNSIIAQYSIVDFIPLYQLTGSWKMNTQKGALIESWVKQNDSTLISNTVSVIGIDTSHKESVVLKYRGAVITYTAVVADQNNQQAVVFTLSEKGNGKYIFENLTHDFPQQIFYHLPLGNSLNAGISGMINNQYREVPFIYTKVIE